MKYKRLLELAEYGAWKHVVEADAKYHALFMKSMREEVDEKELDLLESELDNALMEHSDLQLLIDTLGSF